MVAIRNHTYSSVTVDQYFTQFTRRHFQYCVFLFFVRQLSRCTGTSYHFTTLSGLQFNVVNHSTQWHIFHHQSISDLRSYFITSDDVCTHLNSLRSDDVSFLSIRILNQCDERSTVRIVFDRYYCCRNISLVSFEIDDTIMLLATTTHITHGTTTLRVTSSGFLLWLQQTLFRLVGSDLSISISDSPACSCGHRFVLLQCHFLCFTPSPLRETRLCFLINFCGS